MEFRNLKFRYHDGPNNEMTNSSFIEKFVTEGAQTVIKFFLSFFLKFSFTTPIEFT